MTTLFAVAMTLYILTAAADLYTTKRAVFDHYHGWNLGFWEKNKVVRFVWKVLGINQGNAVLPGPAQARGVAVMIVQKTAFAVLGVFLFRWVPGFAVGWLAFISLLQAWAANRNRELILKKRRQVDEATR